MPGELYTLGYFQGLSVNPEGPDGNSGCGLSVYLGDLLVFASPAICGIGAAPPSNYGTCVPRSEVTAFEQVSMITSSITDRVKLMFIFDCIANENGALATNSAYLDAISLLRDNPAW